MNPIATVLAGLVVLAMVSLIRFVAQSGRGPETHRMAGQLIALRCPDHPEVTELALRMGTEQMVCRLCGKELEVVFTD